MRTVPSTIEKLAVQAQMDEAGRGHERSRAMLEFYSVRSLDFASSMRPLSAARSTFGVAPSFCRAGARVSCAVLCCCALDRAAPARARTTAGPGSRPRAAPTNAEPPPPAVNLSGFPLPYRQGYADGCASATGPERKDAARFASDGNYRTGWTRRPRAVPQEVTERAAACAAAVRRRAAVKPLPPHRVVAARPRASRADVGRSRMRRSSSCCTAGWMSVRRSSFWSMRSRASGT